MWVVTIVDKREEDPIPDTIHFYYDNYEEACKHATHLKRIFTNPKNVLYGLAVRVDKPVIRSKFGEEKVHTDTTGNKDKTKPGTQSKTKPGTKNKTKTRTKSGNKTRKVGARLSVGQILKKLMKFKI